MNVSFSRPGWRSAMSLLPLLASALLLGADEPVSFARRRAELVARYDANHDGRLDDAERERMRAARGKERLGSRAGSMIPAEFLAKYDTSKDGEMQPEEWKVAWDAETKVLTETYDADKDGQLGKTEKAAMMADVRKGEITGVPAYFAGRLAEDAAKSEPAYLDAVKANQKFDADGDGRASAAELERIRAERAKSR